MAEGLLRYQNLTPESKLDRIVEVAAQKLCGQGSADDELIVMRLALELRHEYAAAQVAQKLLATSTPAQRPDDHVPETDAALKQRLAKVLEDNDRLREKDRKMEKVRREMQDLLVTRNRTISGYQEQLRRKDERINSLQEALKNPLHPVHDQIRETERLMQAVPAWRG